MLYQCILSVTAAILFFSSTEAQDTLILNDGSEMHVKVLEVGGSTVSYKKSENLAGPTYTAGLANIFMAIYKGGKRETFTNEKYSAASVSPLREKNAKDNAIAKAVMHDDNFEVRLMKTHTAPDKKDRFVSINADIDVYVNGKLFTEMVLVTQQAINKQSQDASTLTISILSEKLQQLLWDRYESYSGKGYRWDLPPGFFSMDPNSCSIRFYQQKSGNKEILGFGGLSFTDLNLKDCSSLEKKLLSVALVWLETNFGK